AGASISGGQVYGSSDKLGAYPTSGRMEPQDLSATILHLLGIGHEAFFRHPTGRPIRATEGTPIYAVLGDAPATKVRTVPEGNLRLVSVYNSDPLLTVGFEEGELQAVGSGRRLKGWQATPLQGPLRVMLREGPAGPRGGQRHAALGYGLGGDAG